jgi:hypothetical protein
MQRNMSRALYVCIFPFFYVCWAARGALCSFSRQMAAVVAVTEWLSHFFLVYWVRTRYQKQILVRLAERVGPQVSLPSAEY